MDHSNRSDWQTHMHYLNRSQEQNKNEGEIHNPTNRTGGGIGDWGVRDREMPQSPPADTEGGVKEAGLHKAGRGRVTRRSSKSPWPSLARLCSEVACTKWQRGNEEERRGCCKWKLDGQLTGPIRETRQKNKETHGSQRTNHTAQETNEGELFSSACKLSKPYINWRTRPMNSFLLLSRLYVLKFKVEV